MGIEVILHHSDALGVRKVHVNQTPHAMGVIHSGAMTCHLHMPPSLQRGKEHEQVAHPIALILVVDALRWIRWLSSH